MHPVLATYTRYLHENIPLTKAMGITVSFYDGRRAVLRAPFNPNINHRHTIFGGSIANIGILAGWFVLHERLGQEKCNARLVIQKSMVDYLLPGTGDFFAECRLEDKDFASMLHALQRRGKGRITVTAHIITGNTVIATHQGIYVALSL